MRFLQRRQEQRDILFTAGVSHQPDAPDLILQRAKPGCDSMLYSRNSFARTSCGSTPAGTCAHPFFGLVVSFWCETRKQVYFTLMGV